MTTALWSRVARNTVANYGGAAVLILLPVLTLPSYLHNLGDMQWALVGIVVTLQSLLLVVDAGISQVLIREFARRTADRGGDSAAAASLLASGERFYWILGGGVGVLVALASTFARNWLNLPPGSSALGGMAIFGAGFLCALQLPGTLYRGVLLATQKHMHLNVVVSGGAILRYGGGVVVVWLSPTIATYLAWHIASFALDVYVRSRVAWNAVGGRSKAPGVIGNDMRMLASSMSLWALAAGLGAVTVQIDKIVLSGMRSVQELASYFVASQIAFGAMQLFYPFTVAMLPVLMRPMLSSSERWQLNLRMTGILLALLFALGVFILLFGGSLFSWWLGPDRASEVTPLLKILLFGVGCNALCNVGYADWLAHNRRVTLLVANIAALCVAVVSTPFLVSRAGIPGAAMAWSLSQFIVFIISLGWIRNAYKST